MRNVFFTTLLCTFFTLQSANSTNVIPTYTFCHLNLAPKNNFNAPNSNILVDIITNRLIFECNYLVYMDEQTITCNEMENSANFSFRVGQIYQLQIQKIGDANIEYLIYFCNFGNDLQSVELESKSNLPVKGPFGDVGQPYVSGFFGENEIFQISFENSNEPDINFVNIELLLGDCIDQYQVILKKCSNDIQTHAPGDDRFIDDGSFDNKNKNSVSICPNPALDGFKFSIIGTSEAENYNIILCDNLGRTIFKIIEKQHTDINIQSLPSGMYFLKILSNGEYLTGRLIKLD